MYCDGCGAKLPENSRYCGVCGKNLSDRIGQSYLCKQDVKADEIVPEVVEAEEEQESGGGFSVVLVLAIILLVCSFAFPMYSFFGGLFPDSGFIWTVEDTFEAFEDCGMDALGYRGVSLHFWTWIAGAGLLLMALCRSKALAIISAITGIIAPGLVIVELVDYLGSDVLDLSDGCLGAGYYIPMILFAVSIFILAKYT